MSQVLEVAEGDYAYTHDLPVEYEDPEDAKRRQNRNTSRKSRVVASARRAGVRLYAEARDLGGNEFDPTATTETMLAVAEGDYTYAYDLPVEYETHGDAKRRRKRNSSRKSRVVASARQAGAPLYDVPLDSDGGEFDPEEQRSETLWVASRDPAEREPDSDPHGPEFDPVLAPPADFWDRVAAKIFAEDFCDSRLALPLDFWDRVADRVADRLAVGLLRQAPHP